MKHLQAISKLPTKETRKFAFTAMAVSLFLLSYLAFQSKFPLVFYRFDGTYLLITAIMQKTWAVSEWFFTSNPLEGIGGLELPQHNLIDPALWLAAYLPPSIGPTAAMTFYAFLLALSIFWLATRFGMAPLPTVFAAWLGPLLALPYTYPSLGFEFLWGDPTYIMLIALDTTVILLFLDFGRGPLFADYVRFFAIAAACTYQLIQFPNFAPVSLLVVIFFGIVALAMAASLYERLVKLAGAIVLGSAAATVFGRLIFGLYGFAKPTFFWYEFFPRPGTLRDISFLLADYSRWPAWTAYGLSLAGALHAAVRAKTDMRPMARGFLLFVLATLTLILLVNERWKGPRIAYLDILLYPFYCAFAAHGAAIALILSLKTAAPFVQSRMRLAALCALPWLVLVDYRPAPLERPLARNLNPFIWPPLETPITKFLSEEIGLRPGSPFRGRLVSIAGSDFDPQWVSAPFIAQHSYDGMSLFFSGNDHRMYGLWYYGIPTLFESNQFSSPFFHLINARLLNAAGARDLRSYETQSITNDRIMALLGARYLLSDKLLPERAPVLSYRLAQGRDLYVYAISGANLAGYAVTNIRHAVTGRDVIELLADPSVDVRTTAVLTTSDELPPLTTVSRSELTMQRGSYRVEAHSAGTSLLVLPIEYSHCFQAMLMTSSETPVRVVRVNLTMLGILFHNEVHGALRLRYGPLSSRCRIEDWRDADALKIGEARDWPQR